jgi:lipoate-protein ligase A
LKSKEKTPLFNGREEIHRRIQEIVEKFRQKGATNAEKAMTIQELGLPQRFEQAMHRRLGQTGIFVEVKGKYYLNEERLRQFQEQRANSGSIGYAAVACTRSILLHGSALQEFSLCYQ